MLNRFLKDKMNKSFKGRLRVVNVVAEMSFFYLKISSCEIKSRKSFEIVLKNIKIDYLFILKFIFLKKVSNRNFRINLFSIKYISKNNFNQDNADSSPSSNNLRGERIQQIYLETIKLFMELECSFIIKECLLTFNTEVLKLENIKYLAKNPNTNLFEATKNSNLLVIINKDKSELRFYLSELYKNLFGIDTLNITLNAIDDNHIHNIFIKGGIHKLTLNHYILSELPILIEDVEFEINSKLSNNKIETNDCTFIIDKVTIPIYFDFNFEKSELFKIAFAFRIDNNLIDLLASNFKYNPFLIDFDGYLEISVTFAVNIFNVHEYFFNAQIEENTIKIKKWNSDLSFLNSQFSILVEKNGNLIRKLLVKFSNSGTSNIDNVSSKLIDVILICEDPNFYKHCGLDIDFIGYSFIENIANKKIKRGSSTITMQVVRNVFLNQTKNITRKIEEILIALLIENFACIPKRRILEIYLNIIEFGPNIYGIFEASKYYFGKVINELSITECITLSYIIPRPLFFHDALLRNSLQLKKNFKAHYNRILKRLCEKNILKAEDLEKLEPKVVFSNELGLIDLNSP